MSRPPGLDAQAARRFAHWAATPIGAAVLAGRPVPQRPPTGSRPLPEVDMRWVDRARCSGADETTSFVMTEATYEGDLGDGDLADLCGACPVAYQCLDAGIRTHSYGVWGGLVLDRGRPAPHRKTDSTTARRTA